MMGRVADLARELHPRLADRIWTGSVMSWLPPRQFTYVTALEEQVPPHRLSDLVDRLLDLFVEPDGLPVVVRGELWLGAGRYVWHCHIVEHEDNEMMRPYTVG
jgi:Multicopper oxidase